MTTGHRERGLASRAADPAAASARASATWLQFGFNVIGHMSAMTGLGVTARHFASVVRDRGFPFAILDIPASAGALPDRTFAASTVASAEALPYAINVFVLPPQTFGSGVATHSRRRPLLLREGVLNANLLMWEHLAVPPAWCPALEILDVIVAPSPFIRGAVESSVNGVLTLSAEHPLAVPAGIRADRKRFGLPDDSVIFVTSFELYSVERKNSHAAIHAFRRAFAGRDGAALVVKVNHPSGNARAAAELRMLTDGDPRIHLIDAQLGYEDVLRLYASCDVFVSLHRSEGLGLALMESMALGKPVIGTGWSGNMAFMDPTNSCLVGYRLVPVVASNPEYRRAVLGRSAMWADPDLDDAAGWMAKLARDPDLRDVIGRRALASMAAYGARASRGEVFDQLEAMWRHQTDLPALRRKRTPAFRQQWRAASARAFGPSRVREVLDRHVLWRLPRRFRAAP